MSPTRTGLTASRHTIEDVMLETTWLGDLAASRERTLGSIASIDPAALSSLADMEAFGALNLEPMPVDPLEHLRVGFVKTRP